MLIAGFAMVRSEPLVIVVAQIAFGMGCGLIYYSSLFYSMDIREAKAEHGGLQEPPSASEFSEGRRLPELRFTWRPTTRTAARPAATLILGLVAMLVRRYRMARSNAK